MILSGRYDYEGVGSDGANEMMEHLRSSPAQPGDDMGSGFTLQGMSLVQDGIE